jgi:hypothetical protein
MNEKYLRELWEKSKHPHPKYGGQDMIWPAEFAELIIQECIENIEQFDHHINPASEVVPIIVSQVKQHFGIN